MDRALRNSDKVNLDLALSEMDLGLYSAENQADQQVSTGNDGLPCKTPRPICGDIAPVWHT